MIAKGGKFKAKNSDGKEMLFIITSEKDKTCSLGGSIWNERGIDKETTGPIVIPSKVEGYTVTEIGNCAFSDCSSITSVSLPSTLKKIRTRAFINCTSLTQITGYSNVEYVEESAFGNTPWYDGLPDGLIYIGRALYAYKGVIPDNTTIKIKEGTTCIANKALYEHDRSGARWSSNNGLVGIEIPASVNIIGYDNAHWDDENAYYWDSKSPRFFNSINLQSIVIDSNNKYYSSPENSNTIVEKSTGILIAACNNAKIPSSVRAVSNEALSSIKGITSLNIPDNVEVFGGVQYCQDLELITFGKNVRKIRQCYDNYMLKKIFVSPDNPYYDSRNDCNAVIEKSTLKLIVGCAATIIPEEVEEIPNLAFRGNGRKSTIKTIVIPDKVKKIGNGAFSGQTNLESVVIGRNVKEIEDNAFGGYNNKLMAVYSLNDYPTEISEKAFLNDTYEQGTLYVPTGSVINYMGTIGWNKFKNIIEFDSATFDPSTLDINSIMMDSNESKTSIYNMQGQRLTAPKKGINIIGGKKVVVK